ncbi:MAG: C-GCAxxG-C-C family protein [Clostridiales bacterium]|jgi:C_GCAxxG_C_C family probable redox protein|nr:C-GCAxxG-C-C family protein [Clostridiales bacterium]
MREKAVFYYKRGYGCSESILLAAEEHYKIDLPARLLDMCAGINTGFGVGAMCAVVIAAALLFGLFFEETDVKRVRLRFIEEFNRRRGSLDCGKIIEGRSRFGACESVIADAAEIASSLIDESFAS